MSTLGTNLDKINDQLDGITDYVDKITSDFENKSQAYIDAKMEVLSTEVSEKLNKIKDVKIVPPLHIQYENALAQIELLQPLVELDITDLPSVIEGLLKVVAIVTAPYQPAIDFITEIAPKIVELAGNIQTVATYQPEVLGVEVPPLDIDISLSLQDIIDG